MNKNLILGLVAAVLMMLPAEVYAASLGYARKMCLKQMTENPPQVEIKYNYGDLKIDHEQSAEQLAEMMSELYPLKVNHKMNGLTSLSPYAVVESDIVRVGVGGYLCYYPQKVSVIMGYDPTVYIRNDLSENTCRYDVTMRHEQTHLDIGSLSLERFVQTLKTSIPDIIKSAGVIVRPMTDKTAADETSAALNNLYRQKVGVLFNTFVQDMIKQQIRIDSMESYEYEGSLCPDES